MVPEQVAQVVSIVWVDEDKAFNIGIKSVLDGKPMDGISSLRIHSGPDMTQVAAHQPSRHRVK